MAAEGTTNATIRGQEGATILFANAREAVKHGDIEYVRGYIMSVAGAVTNAGSDGKTLLHSAALSGQTSIIAELLVAGADPYTRCSSGETPLDLAKRNGHDDALSCLLRHPTLSARARHANAQQRKTSQTPNGPGNDAVGTALALAAATDAAPATFPGKGARSPFRPWRRSSLKGGDGGSPNERGGISPANKTKKGRGKRPELLRLSGDVCETPHGAVGVHDGGLDVGCGWVLYTDAEGFQCCWNETLKESRWVDQSTALLAAPAPSPASYLDASPYSQSTGGGGGGGGSGGTCGPSPAYSNASGHLWENNVYGWGNSLASPVHSPGWPSPRATEGGLMQLPLPPTPTSYFAAGAATRGAAFPAMPPSPPSTSSNVRGDAVGVAWLAETKATKTAKETTGVGEGTAGAAGAAGAAVAGGARNSAVADEGIASLANSAFYGQEHSPSPATKGKLWAERVKAGAYASKTDEGGAPPDADKKRGWMKNFRHRRGPKEKGRVKATNKTRGGAGGNGSGTFVEPGNDGDDISALTEATSERDRRDGGSSSSSSSSSESGSGSSTSSGSRSSSSSGSSSSSTSTSEDSSSSSSTDSSDSSSDSSDTSTSSGTSIHSGTVDPTTGSMTLGQAFVPQPAAPVTTTATREATAPPTARSSGGDNTFSLPSQTWAGEQPAVVGVPAGYAYPVATAVPSGDGDDDAPLAGWADLEPQTLPPYAPTALWRQEEAPTGYDGVADPPESSRTYAYELDRPQRQQQQQQQQLPGETENLITLSYSPPSNI